MDNRIILVGCANKVVELCEESKKEIIGIIDNNIKDQFMGYPIIGTDNEIDSIYENYKNVPILVTPDKPEVKKKIVCLYKNRGFKFATVISPYAIVSPYAKIGVGVSVYSGCIISSFAQIANYVRVNTSAHVMHDVVVNDFVTIAPCALLLGKTNVGESTYIGAKSVVIEHNKIGSNSVVGAGAVVTKNIPSDEIWVGNPARYLKNKN